ncbi:hypothetical protein GQ44DRAFT_436888 [Phaeosphaeriaceae sp. PMI808]|nr:hypothetical protein GQ44DRAFT_436888 [Phaeosphaeriaceae sp. PMI808]
MEDEFIQVDMIDHDANREGAALEYGILLEIHAEARRCADGGSHEASHTAPRRRRGKIEV